MLRSLWAWSVIVLLIVAWLPLLALVRLFDRDPARYATGRMFRRLGAAMTRGTGLWHVEVEGEMPKDPRRPYVVVSNHQSHADIPVVSNLRWDMKWVAKAELFRVPFVGWMMQMAGDIPVDRGDARSGVAVLAKAREVLSKRCSVMFCPEGTRSPDGLLRPFSDGPFRLAARAGVPILPLALDGTHDALPKHGWRFGPARTMRLAVLDPIETAGLTPAEQKGLRELVHGRIAARIAAWRGVPVAAVLAPEVEKPANAGTPAA
jgi:1-acyl-sn-glycerol-3-phosphate acyltransferase